MINVVIGVYLLLITALLILHTVKSSVSEDQKVLSGVLVYIPMAYYILYNVIRDIQVM